MRSTIDHENGDISIRMDRNVMVDRLPLEDGHDRPLCANFGSQSGEFSILRANNMGNQRMRDRLTL